MNTVKQPEGSKLCAAACVAMIAGVTLDDVLAEVELHPAGYLPITQAIIFLARRDIMLGMNISLDDLCNESSLPFVLDVSVDTRDQDAFVTVASNLYPGFDHAIVWDHELQQFRDPCPFEGEFSPASDYVFKQWLMAYKLERASA